VAVVKTLDRYLIRELLPPFLLALAMFTFLLAVKPMLENAQNLLSKGVDVPTVGFLLLTLLPQALGITIPMAFLAGTLMSLGRLSGDREVVALLACGVSPLRLLQPVLIAAAVAGGADMYVLMHLVPDSNQRFREETFKLIAQRSASDIKPGLFYEGFPGKVLRVQDVRPDGRWTGVWLADTSEPGRPKVALADSGYLALEPARRQVAIVLPGESVEYVPGDEDGVYDIARRQDVRFPISAESVFGSGELSLERGLAEMTIADLERREAEKRAAGVSPHPEIIQRHQMFSFPVACLVFAFLGLAFGVHTRKDGKLGGFTLGIGVLFAYYGVMALFQNLTKGGDFPAVWARWVPNLTLGAVGLLALGWRMRSTGGELTIRWPQRLSRRAGTSALPRTPAAPVLVIRIPELALPRPRLLDLYLAKRYVAMIALAFFGLLALYYIGTFIDKSERLFKGQATTWMLLQFFYYSTPQFIAYVVPMAILVAVLATIGGLTRTSELIVMRACGVSLYRAAVPLLLLSLVWAGGLFFLDDRVLAAANQKADRIEDQLRGALPRGPETLATARWLVDEAGRVYYYQAFDIPKQTLHGLSVFEINRATFRLSTHTLASTAVYRNGAWHAERGWVQHFPTADRATREPFAARTLPLAPPSRFTGMQNRSTETMTFGELRTQIAQMSKSGASLAEANVTLQQRIAFPLVTVVMTLLGIPFGATTGRRGALYGIGIAIILGSAYWLLNTFFIAVGQASLLRPELAAWAANILFLALAGYLTLTVRT
jgi:LPS export ABC transporter permease LptG/LPS export ABC transporter permease LptF